jgi:hypothetical protein
MEAVKKKKKNDGIKDDDNLAEFQQSYQRNVV